MSSTQAFQEEYTVTIAAGTAAASAALPAGAALSSPLTAYAGDALLVFNAGAAVAHLSLNGTATTGNLPIPPGGSRLLTIGPMALTASVILDSGTGTVYLSRGTGYSY
jgi:hypothetical protein